MAELESLVRYLDSELRTAETPDHAGAMNGLQLANSGRVTRVAAAVDFSLDAVRGAVREKADLLLVHHGMFWRPERLVGPAYERLKAAVLADLAVYASHLPLDMHPRFGNNTLLARELGLDIDSTFGRYKGVEIGVSGACDIDGRELLERVRRFAAGFGTTVVNTPIAGGFRVRRWAIITGAGATSETLDEAIERGVDTLIVGEGAHHTGVQAREHGLVVVYGGHYATETLGVRALADHLVERFDLTAVFVDVPTGL